MTAFKTLIFLVSLGAAAPALATDGTAPEAPALPAAEAWSADPALRFDAADVVLEDFKWIARPIVVFADTPADPRFREQIQLLDDRPDALSERDVVVITDTAPAAKSDLRQKLRPRGFMIVLIGKDGGVKLRKPFPWDVRELSRQIDKIPLRQQEIRAAKSAAE
jgi:hypothetical protein